MVRAYLDAILMGHQKTAEKCLKRPSYLCCGTPANVRYDLGNLENFRILIDPTLLYELPIENIGKYFVTFVC